MRYTIRTTINGITSVHLATDKARDAFYGSVAVQNAWAADGFTITNDGRGAIKATRGAETRRMWLDGALG